MKRIERCEYGRIRSEKRRLFIGVLSMIAIGVAIFVLGLFLNKFEKRNIFTVVAVLFVLPMARYLATLLIMLPHKTPERALYEQVKTVIPRGSILLSDYLFTSSERAMGVSFLVLTGHELIGLVERDKEKTDKITVFLSGELKKREIPGKVVLYEDANRFTEALKRIPEATRTEEEMKELLEFLRSLAV
ncbi:MAG: hypothetical protein J6J38_02650 [Lachnospiraceae bacterium]|nr:hypothetical protein [Lachnospiraceae bacterium]